MELKFANSQDVYSFTYNSIRETLLYKELIPDVAPGKDPKPETFKKRDVGKAPEAFENKRREALVGDNTTVKAQEVKPAQLEPSRRSVIDVIDETKNKDISKTYPAMQQRADTTRQVRDNSSTYSAGVQHDQVRADVEIKHESAAKPVLETERVAETKPALENKSVVEQKTSLETEKNSTDVDDKKYVQQNMFQEKFLTERARAKHRLIGQLFKTYWLIEYDGKFFIMDQFPLTSGFS